MRHTIVLTIELDCNPWQAAALASLVDSAELNEYLTKHEIDTGRVGVFESGKVKSVVDSLEAVPQVPWSKISAYPPKRS